MGTRDRLILRDDQQDVASAPTNKRSRLLSTGSGQRYRSLSVVAGPEAVDGAS